MPRFSPTPDVAPVPSIAPRGPFPPAPGAATAQAGLAGGPTPMTLDALMMRQKRLSNQAQDAGSLNNGTIFGGLGYMAQQALGGLQERGVVNDINAAQQDIAGNFGKAFDPMTGEIDDAALQAIASRDPQTAMELYQQAMAARQQARDNAFKEQELALQKQKLAQEAGGEPAKLSDIGSLRDDYVKAAGTYDQAAPAWEDMLRSYNVPEKQGAGRGSADYNLIIGYAKLLDPNSVVREGEVASASMTEGMINQIQSMLNQWTSNGMLNDETRRGIMQAAQSRMQAYYGQVKSKRDWLAGVATRHGMNPDDVVAPLGELKLFEDQQTNAPPSFDADPNDGVAEGTVITNDQGVRYKRQGSKWVRVQ